MAGIFEEMCNPKNYFRPNPSSIAWAPCKIYGTAKIGKNVSIGAFSEVGNEVCVGNNVKVGAMCFIPEGVVIEDGAWVGPRVTFSNDMFPPSGKEQWQKTLVKKGSRIGAGVCIRPGVTIGENALIGMGSVVVHDVPAGETWVGVPAKNIEERKNGDSKA